MNKKGLFILLFISVLAFSNNKEESQRIYQEASQIHKQGKIEEAIGLLRKAIELDNGNFWAKKLLVEILLVKGEETYNQGLEKSAFEIFKEAYKLWPNNANVSFWYNRLKAREGQLVDKKIEEKKEIKKEEEVKKEEIKKEEETKKEIAKKEEEMRKEQQNIQAELLKQMELYKKELEEAKKRQMEEMKNKKTTKEEINEKKALIEMEERFNNRVLQLLKAQQELEKAKEKKEEKTIVIQQQPIKTEESKNISPLYLFSGALFLLGTGFIVIVLSRRKKDTKTHFTLPKDNFPTEMLQELVHLYKIEEIAHKIQKGELDWEVIKKNIRELNKEIRMEIIEKIENKIERDKETLSQSQFDLLLALLFDPDEYIAKRSQFILQKNLFNEKKQLAIESNTRQSLPSSSLAIENKNQILSQNMGVISEVIDLKIAVPLAKIVDRKIFNQSHSLTVGKGCYHIASELNLSQKEINLIYIAGLLHDIGYFDIFSELVKKKGKLSKEECDIVKTHPQKGLELLDFAVIPDIVAEGILYHHERWDGSGYPKGLAGENIPMVARIVGIMDAYEAMISPRPHRPPYSETEALLKIKESAGIAFDPTLVKILEMLVVNEIIKKESLN